MSIAQSFLWGIVSAGGEEVRLKEFVRTCVGTDVPKQFFPSAGSAHRHEAVPW
jgi:hypothetical protein